MLESVGKRLSHARQKRGLTIDEAAHATKLRPDKIAALESDDYSRFANNIYARGFLQMYARFLNVDVADFARTLDNANPINVSDYQYLSNAPMPRQEAQPMRRDDRHPPSFAPLLVFVALIALGLAGSWFYANYQRIVGDRPKQAASAESTPAPGGETEFVSARPPLTPPTPIRAAAVPTPIPVPPRPFTAPGTPPSVTGGTALPTPLPLAATTPSADQDFVMPPPVSATDPNARPLPPGGKNEVLVAAVKKTWVTVWRDDPKAAPIFEDYIYPNTAPLKLKGARFFIEAREPAAVQITKNGLPFAYQPPGVPVQ